jgi:hypothetical protein
MWWLVLATFSRSKASTRLRTHAGAGGLRRGRRVGRNIPAAVLGLGQLGQPPALGLLEGSHLDPLLQLAIPTMACRTKKINEVSRTAHVKHSRGSGRKRGGSPLPFLHDEALLAILVDENLLKVVGNAGAGALELRKAHRPQVGRLVVVVVLVAPPAGTVEGALADTGDVDEHAVLHVDPAGVDDVAAVALCQLAMVRVDVEEVR